MATPTILANPSKSSSTDAPIPTKATLSVGALLIAALAGVALTALGASAAMYYLARTGKLTSQAAASRPAADVPPVTHLLVLEPLLVNLADAGGSSYLRVALTLRVADAAKNGNNPAAKGESKEGKSNDDSGAAVRDTVLAVLGRQTSDDLLAADGKEHLKVALKSGMAQHNPDLKVVDVFFTDFLVQR
jgi:flagellar protein FliL